MKRSYPLTVDCLEDRCVPAVIPLVQVVAIDPGVAAKPQAVVVQAPAPNQPLEVAPQFFVIDGYLIDPNAIAPPPKPLAIELPGPIPDAYWQTSPWPQSLVPPINPPFWY